MELSRKVRTPLGLLWVPLAAWVLIAVIGYRPTRTLAGWSGLAAMFVAQALVMAVVYATMVPTMRRMRGADAAGRVRLALKAGAIRLILTVALAAMVAWFAVVESVAFLVWVGISYVLMVQLETLTLVYWSRHLEHKP